MLTAGVCMCHNNILAKHCTRTQPRDCCALNAPRERRTPSYGPGVTGRRPGEERRAPGGGNRPRHYDRDDRSAEVCACIRPRSSAGRSAARRADKRRRRACRHTPTPPGAHVSATLPGAMEPTRARARARIRAICKVRGAPPLPPATDCRRSHAHNHPKSLFERVDSPLQKMHVHAILSRGAG